MKPLQVALVGCGNIAPQYARELQAFEEVQLRGCFDRNPGRSQELAEAFDCLPYPTLEALLQDGEVDLVVNLTLLPSHFAVSKAALLAGKHVYSEKPLAATSAEAFELVQLAEQQGLRLGCAPITFLGQAQQQVRHEIEGGTLGQVRLVYAEANHGRIESWHPSPAGIYGVGPLWDVGIYPLSLVTAVLGPVRQVWAYATTVLAQRTTLTGEAFQATAPDFQVLMLELHSGATVRLTASFYTTHTSIQQGIEWHGDRGQLQLGSWVDTDASVQVAAFGEAYRPLPSPAGTVEPFRYALGIQEMALALQQETPHRSSAQHAAHLVEVLEAAAASLQAGGPVQVQSRFELPHPLQPQL